MGKLGTCGKDFKRYSFNSLGQDFLEHNLERDGRHIKVCDEFMSVHYTLFQLLCMFEISIKKNLGRKYDHVEDPQRDQRGNIYKNKKL